MDYKKSFYFILFLYCVSLGFAIEHDVSKVLLSISSVLFAYGFVCLLFRRKILMILFFVVMSVASAQISVTAKDVIYQRSEGNSAGDIVGDIVYGFYNIKSNLIGIMRGVKMARKGDYTGFNLNYRLVVVGIMLPLMVIALLFRRVEPRRVNLPRIGKKK